VAPDILKGHTDIHGQRQAVKVTDNVHHLTQNIKAPWPFRTMATAHPTQGITSQKT